MAYGRKVKRTTKRKSVKPLSKTDFNKLSVAGKKRVSALAKKSAKVRTVRKSKRRY